MANKRNKRKLTLRQAYHISWLAVLIYAILTIIRGIYLKPTGDQFVTYLFVNFGAGIFCISILFYFFILKVPDKESDERQKKAEIRNIQRLSSTVFTQVCFCPTDTGGNMEILMTILQNEGCTFYAKITENNCIHLLVKDKHDEEVFNEKIGNHLYFALNFKFMP